MEQKNDDLKYEVQRLKAESEDYEKLLHEAREERDRLQSINFLESMTERKPRAATPKVTDEP